MSLKAEPEAHRNSSFGSYEFAGIVVDELIPNGVSTFLYRPGPRNGAFGFQLSQIVVIAHQILLLSNSKIDRLEVRRRLTSAS